MRTATSPKPKRPGHTRLALTLSVGEGVMIGDVHVRLIESQPFKSSIAVEARPSVEIVRDSAHNRQPRRQR